MRETDAAKITEEKHNASEGCPSHFVAWNLFLSQNNNGSLQYALQAQTEMSIPVAVTSLPLLCYDQKLHLLVWTLVLAGNKGPLEGGV